MKSDARRERPKDGGIVWYEKLHAFQCEGCFEFEEIRKRGDREPDRLAELRELLVIEHTECWEFDDPQQARQARKYRKAKKLRENMARASGLLDCSEYLRRGSRD